MRRWETPAAMRRARMSSSAHSSWYRARRAASSIGSRRTGMPTSMPRGWLPTGYWWLIGNRVGMERQCLELLRAAMTAHRQSGWPRNRRCRFGGTSAVAWPTHVADRSGNGVSMVAGPTRLAARAVCPDPTGTHPTLPPRASIALGRASDEPPPVTPLSRSRPLPHAIWSRTRRVQGVPAWHPGAPAVRPLPGP